MTFVIVMGFHQIIVVMNDVKRHTYIHTTTFPVDPELATLTKYGITTYTFSADSTWPLSKLKTTPDLTAANHNFSFRCIHSQPFIF